MNIKRLTILLGLLIVFNAGAWGEQFPYKLLTDSQENPYKVWTENNVLKYSKSIDRGATFSPPATFYTFTREVLSFDLKIDRDFYLEEILREKECGKTIFFEYYQSGLTDEFFLRWCILVIWRRSTRRLTPPSFGYSFEFDAL